MTLQLTLSDFGRTFATRGRGDELRRMTVERLAGDNRLVLDCAGVAHVSYSFADEYVARLAAEDDVAVEVRNADATVLATVERAIARRSDPALC